MTACLTRIYIPFPESWRCRLVRLSDGAFNRQFFPARPLIDRTHLDARSRALKTFHLAHHSHNALAGLMPYEPEH